MTKDDTRQLIEHDREIAQQEDLDIQHCEATHADAEQGDAAKDMDADIEEGGE